MKAFIQKMRASSKELSNLKKLVFSAMLLAMVVVLKTIGFNNQFVKAGLNAIPANMAYQILGPVGAMLFGAASDLLGVLVLGQTVNLGITFAAVLSGFIMGAFLYGHKVSIVRIAIASLVKTVICSLILNTLFIALMMYPTGDPEFWSKTWALFLSRCVKNAIEVPVTAAAYYFIAKALEKIRFFKKLEKDQ